MIWAVGCAYHVAIESHPTSAQVKLPDDSIVVTPARIELRWAPFAHQWVEVSAPGYRTATVDLQRHPLRWSLKEPPAVPVFRMADTESPPRVRFELVPEHGPVGTWSEVEVP